MKLIIQAANVHQGGGRQLLLAVMRSLEVPATILIDDRFGPLPEMPESVEIHVFRPSLLERLKAELRLGRICGAGDTVLCFGNLPPLFRVQGKVFVYLQNRYLSKARPLQGFPWKVRLRLYAERFWLRFCLRDGRIIVQSDSMAREVRETYSHDSMIFPFTPLPAGTESASEVRKGNGRPDHDFIYVASGEPHKNHKRLVEAWKILAAQGLHPSLCLTLDEHDEPDLFEWIGRQREQYQLNLAFEVVKPGEMDALYGRSAALIYPSLLESFGLPLIEAQQAGLPIIASERDFVRDIVMPVESFDPESPLSIARAVMRFLNVKYELARPSSPKDFIRSILKAGM